MEHSFNIELAKKYGILEAILLKNIYFWVKKNKANDKNLQDEYYWTYNSAKAFNELFPYASEKKIRSALSKLEKEGLIKVGNYNKVAYDRTKWYTLTEEGGMALNVDISDFTKRENGNYKKENGSEQNVTPIPDIKTNIKTDIIKERKKDKTNYDEIIKNLVYDQEVKETLYEFIKMRSMMKKPLSDRALTLIISKLNKLSSNSEEQVEILNNSIVNNWLGIFPLKKESSKTQNYILNQLSDEEIAWRNALQ